MVFSSQASPDTNPDFTFSLRFQQKVVYFGTDLHIHNLLSIFLKRQNKMNNVACLNSVIGTKHSYDS